VSENIITWYAFADLHCISRNEARRRWQIGMISSQQLGRSRQAAIVLSAQGMRDFFVQFNQEPGFRTCDQCPHK
jgi:hypothetical protein